ncbi:MAG: O-acetyl-ADP-ribose deacetylase [Gammaproteobacteria bacterium]|nr:O-acetyl-ADP-ribose deacetylase [Gammaproteobacteria bacterium]
MPELRAVHGDITTLEVDAIVNAANNTLLGGGGVDGAIHRAAGQQLLQACRKLGGCHTGEARLTPGFELPARYVIHTVGPVFKDGTRGEPDLLRACYRHSLELAQQHDLKSIAFPAISTGAYRYPPLQAARIAVDEVSSALVDMPSLETVIFCCFSERHLEIYEKLLEPLNA